MNTLLLQKEFCNTNNFVADGRKRWLSSEDSSGVVGFSVEDGGNAETVKSSVGTGSETFDSSATPVYYLDDFFLDSFLILFSGAGSITKAPFVRKSFLIKYWTYSEKPISMLSARSFASFKSSGVIETPRMILLRAIVNLYKKVKKNSTKLLTYIQYAYSMNYKIYEKSYQTKRTKREPCWNKTLNWFFNIKYQKTNT